MFSVGCSSITVRSCRFIGGVLLRSFTNRSATSVQPDYGDTFGNVANRGGSEQKFNLASQRRKQKATNEAPQSNTEIVQHEEEFQIVDDENEDSTVFQPYNFRHKPHWYAHMSKKLAAEGKIAESVAMLEDRMLKEDKVPPSSYNFNLVISILSQKGFTNKAFELYKKMRSYGLDPTPQTFTSLFNACANCPYPNIGLEKAKTLRQNLSARSYVLNQIQYHSMIKAFARNGDLQTAFEIVDEMTANGIRPDVLTFSHLLLACINDKVAGFKLCVEVWRKMLRKKIEPDGTAYNLLLKACRECGIGDINSAKELLRLEPTKPKEPEKIVERDETSSSVGTAHSDKPITLEELLASEPSVSVDNTTPLAGNQPLVCEPSSKADQQPDNLVVSASHSGMLSGGDIVESSWLGGPMPFKGNILNAKFECPTGLVSLSSAVAVTPADRFSLLGGVDGFLHLMKRHNVAPDIRIFSQFLDLIPSTSDAEDRVCSRVTEAIRPDTDFFNLIIKRRCFRGDTDGALEMIGQMRLFSLKPNEMTFGVLACGCKTRIQGAQLLRDMKTLEMTPNIVILTSLMTNSLSTHDPIFTLDVLKELKRHSIQPNQQFLVTIEKRMAKVHETLVKAESSKDISDYYRSSYFRNGYRLLKRYYLMWLKQVKFSQPADPWVELDKRIRPDDLKTERERQWLIPKPRM